VVDFENHGGGICHNLNVNFRPNLDVKTIEMRTFMMAVIIAVAAVPAHAYQADEIC
jgi:hypothetical protein